MRDKRGVFFKQRLAHRIYQEAMERHNRVMCVLPPGVGKTQQNIVKALSMMGQFPHMSGAILGRSDGEAVKTSRQLRGLIEESRELHEVYPNLRPLPKGHANYKWGDHQINIVGHPGGRDFSFQCYGMGSKGIGGARFDWVIGDDLLDFNTTLTEEQQEKTAKWMQSIVFFRLMEAGATNKLWLSGLLWARRDFHVRTLAGEFGEFKNIVLPVETRFIEDESLRKLFGDQEYTFPWVYDAAGIALCRSQNGDYYVQRQLNHRLVEDIASIFSYDDFQACFDLGLAEGAEFYEYKQYHGTLPTITGIDPAQGRSRSKGDLAVLFTGCVHPDGTKQVLRIDAGRYTEPELCDLVIKHHVDFRSQIAVEDDATGRGILQNIEKRIREERALSSLKIVPYEPGKDKHDPRLGIPAIAMQMHNRKWIIPDHKETREWEAECYAYRPDSKVHTGDRLMASLYFSRMADGVAGQQFIDEDLKDAPPLPRDERFDRIGEFGERVW